MRTFVFKVVRSITQKEVTHTNSGPENKITNEVYNLLEIVPVSENLPWTRK